MDKELQLKQRGISEQAADWLLRAQSGDLCDIELERLSDWLEDEGHAEAYNELAIIWSEAGLLEPQQDVFETSESGDNNRKLRVDDPRVDDSSKVKPLNVRKRFPPIFAYAASILLLAGLYLGIQHKLFDDSGQDFQVYETTVGEHRAVSLSDGSAIELGAKTAIRVSYTTNKRAIDLLKGEAFFEVQKETTRPFIVNTGAGQVRSIGTQFNIHRARQKVTVAVIEGAVELSATSDAAQQVLVVSAQQQASFDPDQPTLKVESADVERLLSWRKNTLVFEERSLSRILEDINRYSSREIILMDVSKKDLMISGTFIVGELDEWLDGLEKVYHIRSSVVDKNKILLL